MSLQPHNHTWHCVQNSNHQQSPTMLLSCLLMLSPGTPFISFHFCRCSLGFARASDANRQCSLGFARASDANRQNLAYQSATLIHPTHCNAAQNKTAHQIHQCIKKILFSSKHFRNVIMFILYIYIYSIILYCIIYLYVVSSGSCKTVDKTVARWTGSIAN